MPIGERGWLASVRLRVRVAADLDPNVDGRLDLLEQRHVQGGAATKFLTNGSEPSASFPLRLYDPLNVAIFAPE